MEQKNFDRTRSREVMRLTFDSRSENEEFARVVVAVFATRMNPTLEEIDDIKTAVSEAVTNAVIHGYQNGEGTILIEAAVEENVLSVTVSDDGVGISNIEKAMEPMFSTLPEERSGMGFSFMEAFMDRVEVISSPGGGTSVTMRKKIGR
ncbi:MAG: anti-sigma F factor [Lachnospiraceae bacterium]|nr:anti-sigma F factor [Lachnospiraceae bacterium]MBQ1241271.1 anti-sigma F factor [Lachnospiraceae bacterium]MBQ2105673.1 anti-sigma F factor [Lachnospiraceae bacterium]MBQ2401167.1 anti-sigma F factor [Lachnospiraceae bacterium]MBQ2426642.1 anti-sigma F factor [Lachnospiraceae bacterium]